MTCCGKKRLEWQQSWKSLQEPASPPPEPDPVNPVLVQYDGRSTCMVKGIRSGFLYIFAPGEQGLPVDERDLKQILTESKKFSLAGNKSKM